MPALKHLGTAALLACALGCSGGSSTPAPAGPPATFTQIYPLIFPVTTKAQCNFCHSLPPNDKSNGKLSMGQDKATAYAAIVGKTSSSSKCGGKPLIVPGQPDQSLFFLKLETPPCGDHMPLGGDPLPADQIDMVRSWIAAGAKDD